MLLPQGDDQLLHLQTGEGIQRPQRFVQQQQARAMAAESASLLVVGSSLAVMSGYRFVLDMLASGRPVAVINGGPGRADARVNVLWRTQVGPAFDDLLDALAL